MYSLPEAVWRSSKSMNWSCCNFWTNSTTFRSDNRILDFACWANSNCRCNSSNSSSMLRSIDLHERKEICNVLRFWTTVKGFDDRWKWNVDLRFFLAVRFSAVSVLFDCLLWDEIGYSNKWYYIFINLGINLSEKLIDF